MRCECGVCGKVFGSLSGFDKHRVGTYMPNTRRCLSDGALKKLGLIKVDNIWRGAVLDPRFQPSHQKI